jgi:hypothetical protein
MSWLITKYALTAAIVVIVASIIALSESLQLEVIVDYPKRLSALTGGSGRYAQSL